MGIGAFAYFCTMFRLMMVCCIALSAVAAFGQRQFVVVDVETRTPIRGVNVTSSAHRADTTDYQGMISVPDSCRTLSLTHVKYESRILNVDEVKDTIFLISKLMGLPEVTVFGHGKGEDALKELKKHLVLSKTDAQLIAANPSSGINVIGIVGYVIDKLFRRNKLSKKERFKKMLEEY